MRAFTNSAKKVSLDFFSFLRPQTVQGVWTPAQPPVKVFIIP